MLVGTWCWVDVPLLLLLRGSDDKKVIWLIMVLDAI